VVSQLVTELDALPATVFLIGATNRPDLLDRSLLRPGRLDRMVYLGISKEKLPLLEAVTRKFDLEEAGCDGGIGDSQQLLQAVARLCPSNLTGADVSELCTDAYTIAQKEHIACLQDIASRVHVSIGTLLLFLEALDRKPCKAESWGRCVFTPVFPLRDGPSPHTCVLQNTLGSGLALYEYRRQHGLHILVSHGGASVVFDTCSPDGQSNGMCEQGRPDRDGSQDCASCQKWLACRGNLEVGSVRGFDPLKALRVRVGWRHFQEALRHLQPSVPHEDLQRYEQLAAEYQNTKR